MDNPDPELCDRCGDEYEGYTVLLRKDDVESFKKCVFDNLCKPCRMAVTDYGAYLTKSEREELEPKEEV